MPKSASFGFAQGKCGFTLVELLVVISIIAILSVIGITIFASAQKTARDARRRGDLKAISNAMELYKTAVGEYPFPHNPPQLEGNPWYCSSKGNWANNSQIVNALAPYFSGGIPQDPSIPDNYKMDILSQRSYLLYASLENPPASPWPTTTDDGCGVNTVHILIKGQQGIFE